MCSSPRLIAACHVLHRLLMPRHSPCALISLTFVEQPISKLFSRFHKNYAGTNRFIVVCVTLIILKSTNYLCYLSVACSQFLACFTVQFSRCSFSNLFQGQIETLRIRKMLRFDLVGGDKRNRTAGLLLARQALSQLSYTPDSPSEFWWWAQVDSNHRPHDYQSCALAS